MGGVGTTLCPTDRNIENKSNEPTNPPPPHSLWRTANVQWPEEVIKGVIKGHCAWYGSLNKISIQGNFSLLPSSILLSVYLVVGPLQNAKRTFFKTFLSVNLLSAITMYKAIEKKPIFFFWPL